MRVELSNIRNEIQDKRERLEMAIQQRRDYELKKTEEEKEQSKSKKLAIAR